MRFLSIAITVFLLGMSCACNRCLEPCINGVCKKKLCHCDSWWEGDGCERSVLKRFEGRYEGNIMCNGISDAVELSLVVDPTAPNQLLLGEIGFYAEFTNENEFIIPAQSWQGMTVSGEGQMLVEGVSFYYTAADGVEYTCLVEAYLSSN